MMKRRLLYLMVLLCLPWTFWAQSNGFPLPQVPQMIQGTTNRANYLALHYWDRFDFNDLSLIGKPEITEQGFANFISIMPYVTEKKEAFEQYAKRMTANSKMLEHLLKVSERYLFDSFSPVYDEELYLILVDELFNQPQLSLAQRERLRFQRRMCLKNRINHVAADFNFVLRNGTSMSLMDVKADFVLLYLNDPECSACLEIKEALISSNVISEGIRNGSIKVVSVCIEGKTEGWKSAKMPLEWLDGCDENMWLVEKDLYDLRNLPAIYLLDAHKRILLKNATVQRLEQMLSRIKH